MQLLSPVFEQNEAIPRRYTCQGENINPPLEIREIPAETKSLILICDDPDAATDPDGPGHTYDHWVVWNIEPHETEIKENSVPVNAIVGLNSSGENEYTGPCPPTGTHRYFFRVYAVDTLFDISGNSDKDTVEDALAGHVLARAELIGTYQKD